MKLFVFLLDASQTTQMNGCSDKNGEVWNHERMDRADEDKGKDTSPRKAREDDKRVKESLITSQQQEKEDIFKSETRSKKESLSISNTNEDKGSQENDSEQSGKNSIQKGAGQALEICGDGRKKG